MVHEVLERVDFADAHLGTALENLIVDALRWSGESVDIAKLVAAIEAMIETPLGPQFGGQPLRAITRADRLDEMSFTLTLGQREDGSVRQKTMADVGAAIADHLPAGDPLRPWAIQLADGLFTVDLAGHLTGHIDALFRTAGSDGQTRYVVVDYKTNRLGESGQPIRLADYHPARLPEAMIHHHYPLQALLYAVATHRYLRWRLRDYDPHQHLGGAAYLFARGMIGPGTPEVDGVPYGVFSWPIPAGLIIDLSDILNGTDHR